jgi:hypothetical protein
MAQAALPLINYVLILVFETLYVVYHFNKIFDFYYESWLVVLFSQCELLKWLKSPFHQTFSLGGAS